MARERGCWRSGMSTQACQSDCDDHEDERADDLHSSSSSSVRSFVRPNVI